MTPADEDLIEKNIKEVYLRSELLTLEDSFQKLLEQHYSVINAEGQLVIKIGGERPSKGQFRRRARKYLPAERVIRARKGDAEFELNHRSVLGSLRLATYTVGDIYEIDATVVDVVLVHHNDRSKIVGKACLYMIRDRRSNLIVGYYVGFEEASWQAAMQAIWSITEDKQLLCQRYGVAYDPADWPAHCVMPKEFVADRGSEMLCNASDRIADGLELTVTNLPTRRGDWKPFVECGFKQTHRAMRGVVPGYVPPENFGKRQKHDYSREAALTLEEFRKIILEAIIKHNRSPMPDYPLAPAYVLQNLQPTPLNIWGVEVRDRAGLLNTYSEAEVRLALLPETTATVTREGIQVGHCYYSAPEAIDYGWFVAAGSGRFKVTVSYDLRIVDKLYVHDERHPDLCFEAQLLEKCSHFRGLSHREVEALGYPSGKIKHQGEQVSRQLRADFHQNIAPTIALAELETKKATRGKSRSARKKDTRGARDDARRHERQESVAPRTVTQKEPATVTPLIPEINQVSNERSQVTTQEKTRQQKYEELMNGREAHQSVVRR